MIDNNPVSKLPVISPLPANEVLDTVTAATHEGAASVVPVYPVWKTLGSLPPMRPLATSPDATVSTPSTSDTAPFQVTNVSATQQPYKTADGTIRSLVAVSFLSVSGDPNYDHVAVWFKGYNGSNNWQEIAQGPESPLSFLVDNTGEAVTIKVQAISSNYVPADFDSAPTCTVTLNGVTQAPPAPSISEQTVATAVGYQFAFAYITGLEEDEVQGYWIYKNTTNNPATAQRFKYVLNSATNSGSYTFQEITTEQRFYWVSAVNTSGLESTLQPAQYTTPTYSTQTQVVKLYPSAYSSPSGNGFAMPDKGCDKDMTTDAQGILNGPNGTMDERWTSFVGSVPSGTITKIVLNVANNCQAYNSNSNVSLGYSTDNGNTWSYFYNTAGAYNVLYQVSSTNLSVGQDLSKVQIWAKIWNVGNDSHARSTLGLYEAWIEVTVRVPVVYQDGTNIDSLKPAEAGAEQTTGKPIDILTDGVYFRGTQFCPIVLDNANFEATNLLPPPGWKATAGNPVLAYDTVTPQSGSQSLKITTNGYWQGVVTTKRFHVLAGDKYKIGAYMKTDGVVSCRASLNFYDGGGNQLGYITASSGVTTTWKFVTATGTVPAGTSYAVLYLQSEVATAGTSYFDNVQVIRQSSMDDDIFDGATFIRPRFVNSDGTFHSSTVLKTQGSIIPAQPITINYSYTSNSISLSWGQQTMLCADGSNFTLYAGSTSYTGLSASTRYNVFPYINTSNGQMGFTNGSPPPTGTNPQTLLSLQQNLDGRIPTDPLFVTTAANGSGGGGGTGGGGDVCPEADELVEVQGKGQIPASDVVAGDMILGMNLYDESDVWRRVIGTVTKECAAWRIINGHKVSPCEPVWWDEQWIPAFKVAGAVFDGSHGTKIQITVEADQFDQHNYYLMKEPKLVIHNTRIDPC